MSETPASYFDRLWQGSDDPWDHAARWYEARKYDLTVAALPNARYDHALEPACGPGLLTTRLAQRAERVSASDRFAGAVAATAARCRALPHVTVERRDVRDGPPDGAEDAYDLAVLGECLYYFEPAAVRDVLARWHGRCRPGGHVVLVHYRPSVAEHVLTGDDVHRVATDLLGPPRVHLVDPDFLLAVHDAGP